MDVDVWLTIADAARIYGVSRASIYRAADEGRMDRRFGKVRAVEIEELIEFGVLGVDRRRRIGQTAG